jgi:hypothetical protein
MAFDILQGVQYDPRQDNTSFALVANALDQRNKQYEATKQGIENALGEYGSEAALYSRDPEKAFLAQKLQDITTNLPKMVQDKYAGDYSAARFDVVKQLAKEKQYFDLAKAAYTEEQKYTPLYTKLEAENKLILPNGVDPRTQSIFGEKGQYVGIPKYTPLERPEYGDIVMKDVGEGIDKMVKEGKIQKAEVPWLIKTITERGLSAIKDTELGDRIAKYLPEFEAQTPFTKDPLMQEKYQGNTKKFIEDTLRSRLSSGSQTQYMQDPRYLDALEEARLKRLQGSQGALTTPKLTRLYSTSVVGSKEDIEDTPITDSTFKGQMKRDLIKSQWSDEKGNVNPETFEKTLSKFTIGKNGAAALIPFIQKDSFGKTDVDATMNKIQELADAKLDMGTSGYGSVSSSNPTMQGAQSVARDFLKKMGKVATDKMDKKFGDYGVDVVGFDMTDKNSTETYNQMNDYINQISPDVFNFETGKFAGIKTNKLSKNNDFLKARIDNKFKIQGVIKGADGDIKFVAEDGSGEPQVISSNSDVVNKNLLRMFGSSDLIANFEYKNFKLSPSGNSVVFKDPSSGSEQKAILKGGYKVERTEEGKYLVKDSQGRVYKENGQPRQFDKWEVIHNIGIEEKK